ncbi:hypothetical protein Q3G72_004647 [Acer saccharum]|nr:hypothetical protein Q3G72_004647 [Acer saccharum]
MSEEFKDVDDVIEMIACTKSIHSGALLRPIYVDPEYKRNHHVSASGDVYSFGIVLLQLLSGQRVINLNIDKPMPLDKMAKFLMRGGNIAEFADPKLNGEYSFEAFDFVLKLALSCTELKQQRPSMEQVVLNLEKALDISNTTKLCQN